FALLIIFRLRYGSMGITETMRSFAKISLCSAIMAAACWVGNYYTSFTMHSRFLVQVTVFAGLFSEQRCFILPLRGSSAAMRSRRSTELPYAAGPVVARADTRSCNGNCGGHLVFSDPRKSGERAVSEHSLRLPAGFDEILRICAKAQAHSRDGQPR